MNPLGTLLQGGHEDGATRCTINGRGLWWRFNRRHSAGCACNRVGSHTARAVFASKMACQNSTGKDL